jgi:hypothetical protein
MTTRDSFTHAIWAKAQLIWERELKHPFVRGLGDGYPRNFAADALKLDAEFHPFGQVCASSFEFGCAFRLIHAFDLKSPEREWG